MTLPDWIHDAVFYQIFPDRFANGDPANDPENVAQWDSKPGIVNFSGGDLRGIIHKLDYLLDLGVNAIYLNPIFQSSSNHRYNASDYYRIDPKLGTLDDFRELVDTGHRNNMRVILDGVFNHCGRGFFAFNDILENGAESPYRDWFHIHRFPVDAYSPGDAQDYEAWWRFKSLPKFNTDNPAVRQYLLDVARYWIEQGADGWRLDVPNEIDDDDFWSDFRQVVRQANPEAYIFGEIWDEAPRWVNDTHFDGLMNYPLRTAVLDFFRGNIKANKFASQVERLLQIYPVENNFGMYNLLDSHDTERALTLFYGDVRRLKAAFTFLFAYPGVPSIYYGDEVGVEGLKDPDSRRTFPWDPALWKDDLHEYLRRLITIRKNHPVLRRGNLTHVQANDRQGCYAFARSTVDERLVVVVNASDHYRTLKLPAAQQDWGEGQKIQDILAAQTYQVREGAVVIKLAPYGAAYLYKQPGF
jgi:glycosidase